MVGRDEVDEISGVEEVEENHHHAGFYSTHRQRKSMRLKSKLADLPGGMPRQLAGRVHNVLCGSSDALRSRAINESFSRQYEMWRSILHSGSSLLLHGFGASKQLVEDFVRTIAVESGEKVLSFDGYASNVRPRELLLDLFERMGLPQQGGSAVELCNQLRLAFAMSMQASATTKRAGSSCDEVVTLMLQLLPKGSEAKWAELDTSPMQVELDGRAGCCSAAPQHSTEEKAWGQASGSDNATIGEQNGIHQERPQGLDMVGATVGTAAAASSKRAQGPVSNRLRWRGAQQDDVLMHRTRIPATQPNSAARGLCARLPEHVYVVVHSIDGPALRSDAIMGLLASLAAIPQVHIVASSSHMRTTLLWDATKSRQFNWVWAEANTGAYYAAESNDSMHELLLRLQDAAHSTQGLSAELVLQALTANAKTCFLVLVRHQLDNPGSAGLSLREWFAVCRQEWAATNEANLIAYIKEYMDHNMLKKRPGPGGTECHYCTLPKEVMACLRQL